MITPGLLQAGQLPGIIPGNVFTKPLFEQGQMSDEFRAKLGLDYLSPGPARMVGNPAVEILLNSREARHELLNRLQSKLAAAESNHKKMTDDLREQAKDVVRELELLETAITKLTKD